MLREIFTSCPTPTSVELAPITGIICSPFWEFLLATSLSISCIVALASTLVRSSTTWSFNVIFPESWSTSIPSFAPLVILHLLLVPLVAITVVLFWAVFVTLPLSSNRFVAAGWYVTSNLSTFVLSTGVIVTSPLSAEVTVGAFGFTLIVTSISSVCPLSYVTLIFLFTFPATDVVGGVAVIPFESATNSSLVICAFSPNSDLV